MSSQELEVKVSFAWWLKPYIYGVVLTAVLMGLEPDWEKAHRKVMRAMRVRIQ